MAATSSGVGLAAQISGGAGPAVPELAASQNAVAAIHLRM
jgi:hypothetical protein